MVTWPLSVGHAAFSLPDFISPASGIRLFYVALVTYCATAAFAVARDRSLLANLLRKDYAPYYLFVGINGISLLVVGLSYAAGHRPQMLSLLASFVVFILMTITMLDAPGYERAVDIVIYATAVVLFVLIVEHAFVFKALYLTPTFTKEMFISSGYQGKNPLAFYLSLLFPFVYAKLVRAPGWRNVALFLIFTTGILYCFSRMGVINYVVAIVAFCFLPHTARRRYWVATGAVVCAFVILASATGLTPSRWLEAKLAGQISVSSEKYVEEVLSDYEERWIDLNLDRASYIVAAARGVSERPLFGHGITSFSQDHTQYRGDGTVLRQPVTHNDYAIVAYELGLVGLLTFLVLFLAPLRLLVGAPSATTSVSGTLRDGQLVSLLVLGFSLNMINAYETVLFWVTIAGALQLGLHWRQQDG